MLKTSLIYVERDGCWLMLHRVKKQKDLNRDKWIGVGGKFEAGETPEACARREMLEETGLTAQEMRYRGIVYFYSEQEDEEMHLFTCDSFTGTLSDCNEGTLEWVKICDVGRLNLWEGDKIFLKLLADGAPFFKLKLVYDHGKLIESGIIPE